MSLHAFLPLLSLAAVGYAAAITPGPTFVMLSTMAISQSRWHALMAVLGIVTSGLVWSTGTLLGLGLLFAWLPWLATALQIAGGGYLVWLGVQMWRHKAGPASAVNLPGAMGLGAAWMRGFLTDVLNPKCLLFFGSIFAVFIHPDAPAAERIGAALTVTFVGLTWYGTVALLFSTETARRAYGRAQQAIARVSGTAMLVFGAKLLLMRA